MTRNTLYRKLGAVFLTVALLVMSFPTMALPSVAATDTRVSDPSTMNDWTAYFGPDVPSTQNTGGVWTDKSVFTDASAFDGTGITMTQEKDSFLVALSAIASSTAVEGFSNVPTDTMLVLDLSDSVLGEPSAAHALLQSVNRTINELQSLNRYNRVGVVIGCGDAASSAEKYTSVLLPLSRYTSINGTDGSYLTLTENGGNVLSVDVGAYVQNENGETVAGRHAVSQPADTYTQLGVLRALDQLLAADPTVPADAEYLAEQTRIPVMVLVSDGKPAATVHYTQQQAASVVGGTAQADFLTQLTMAYAEQMLDEHYEDTAPLMYTLSLADDCSADVMDPKACDRLSAAVLAEPFAYTDEQVSDASHNRTVDAYWDLLISDGAVDIPVPSGSETIVTVSQTAVTGGGEQALFPFSKEQKYYVDEAFKAENANTPAEAFDALLSSIELQSHYFPTLVQQDGELSGYISFVDKIGTHMSVTDVKGILINDVLFSGALLSKNFITGGGDLGTFDDPKPLGDELVWAVQARLGIDVNTARDLLGLAYYHGQLSYTSDTEFSNYIGWYTNAAGDFLGFWYDGIETMPDPADPTLTDETRPAYVVRSYGFLGAVDEEHGVVETDLMYATVQVRENILTGEESVVFAVPAALIPTVTYTVALDERGELQEFAVTGAEHPIRLVYEIALDNEINELTVRDIVGEDDAHIGDDGTYHFYTNRFETDNSVGYGKVNTYSYFVPSYQNERYYYTEDSVIYADTNGTVYEGAQPAVDGSYYRAYKIYSGQGAPHTEWVYEPISSVSLAKATQHEDGYWYIPAGTVHNMLEDYIVDKTDNVTQSLTYANIPFVDTQYSYYVGATLGNNGCVSITPATGICLTSTVQGEPAEGSMTFTVTRTDEAENARYDARLVNENGTTEETAVRFTDGVATVSLDDGQSLYIVGMTAGASYSVCANDHPDRKVVSANGDEGAHDVTLTLEDTHLADATFVSAEKGVGDVVITKRVLHDFGASYDMPDKRFTMRVALGEAYAQTTVRAAHSADASITSVMTDKDGAFTVSLGHTDQFELFGLKEGTVVTVTETDIPDGFTPTYYGAGVEGADSVTIRADTSLSLIVANQYRYEEVGEVNIAVGGTKHLLGRPNDEWLEEDVYVFELQRYTDGGWETVAQASVNKEQQSFSFDDAMKAQRFEASGAYSYQVVELVGEVSGVVYDRTVYTFTVTVGDPTMCGRLHILDVTSHREENIVSGDAQSGWTVTADFTNICTAGDRANAVIDIDKELFNPSNSDRVSLAGFRFGLYAEGDTQPAFVSDYTDMVGEARLIATFDHTGVYTYTLKELVPATPIKGMQYSTQEYRVVITVSKNTDGTIRAAVQLTAEDEPVLDNPVFTGTYAPDAARILPEVFTTLDGRDLHEHEFTVRIKDGDTVLLVGTNDADGVVSFENELVFTALGDYYVDVAQDKGNTAGVVYDDMLYRLHITVTDGGSGTLQAHYHVINTVIDTVIFENRYVPASAQVVLEGTKTLIGRDLINDEFNFVLVPRDFAYGTITTAANFGDGTIRFAPLIFETVGEYRYSVHEVQSSTTHGIEFDTTVYDVVVSVTDDGDGVLDAHTRLSIGGEEVESITFVNRYVTTPYWLEFVGVKTLSGLVLENEAFAFELYAADDAWNTTRLLQTAYNDEDGHFAFEAVALTESGVYRYIIKERYGGQTIDGMTYDDAAYRVLVHVSDNNRGAMIGSVLAVDQNGEYADAFVFESTYETPPPTTITTTVMPSTTTSAFASVTSTSAVASTTTAPVATTTTTAFAQGDNPYTGDNTEPLLWLMLLIVSGSTFTALALCGKRKEE